MSTRKRRAKKGTGQVLKAGRTWAYRFTENGSRHYQGGYLTRDAAAQALDTIVAGVKAGLPGVRKKEKPAPLFREVSEEWLKSRKDLRNVQDDRNRWARQLQPLLDHVRLDAVTPAKLEEVGTRGASVERALYLLSSLYRWAIRQGHVAQNPVRAYLAALGRAERKALRSQHDARETPFLERREDVARVFRKLPEPVNIAYALSALAGLRPGEALAVEWADIDWAKAQLTVRRRVRHGRVGLPKSGKGRVVPLGPGLLVVLKNWRERNPSDALVVPPERASRTEKPRHLGPATIKDALDKALKDLKLPPLTFYEAGRHTYASQWAMAGQDIYRLSKILGHASVVTTQRYSHLTDKVPDAVLAAVDVELAPTTSDTR